jgi:4-hydroxy-2-oxoheptanedioate aldolase
MTCSLQTAIQRQGFVVGPFMKLDSPAVVELAGLGGFDFAIIDMEHGPLDVLTAENLVRAAHLRNLCAIIRVGENNPLMIARALDIGADGVQIPQISTAADAERAVRAAKYFPEGERGVCRYVRAAQYSNIPKAEYFRLANRDTAVIIHIEGQEGLRNLDEILKVEGVDVLFIGPYDLSQSLGVPGEVEHPRVVAEVTSMIQKAGKAGKIIGIFAEDVEKAKKYIEQGVQYISYSVDVGLILNQFQTITRGVKGD